ncbi:MAG: Rid family detoxifying hydrolase [Gammaproteobacteria bacterium]
MDKAVIRTQEAPAAIGTYSQAIAAGNLVFLSGQIGLDPATGKLVAGGIEGEARRAFENLAAVARAAGATLGDVVKLNVSLADLGDYGAVNEIMAELFEAPYPARAAVGVAALPRGARVEVEAIIVRSGSGR